MDGRRVAAGWVAVGMLLVAGGWAALRAPEAATAAAPAVEARPAARPKPAPAPDALAPGSVPAPLSPQRPEQFADWMATKSSLRGADLDGSWDIDGQGRLHPSIALRRRFDQLLTLAGEARIEDISAFIEHDVRSLVGAAGAAAVTDAWQRYLELQRYRFASPVRLGDAGSLAGALAERQPVRERILGHALAQAFFADEDAQLQRLISSGLEQADAGALTTRIDPTTLDAGARARLEAEQAAWAGWQRRLETTRRDVAALNAAPQLSALQRRDAVERLLAERFDAHEAVRVRALLQLPPAS